MGIVGVVMQDLLDMLPDVELEEVWRFIPDFEDYAVSSFGRVAHARFDRELRDMYATDGRRKVHLFKNNVRHWVYVHQAVAHAFVEGHRWGDPVGHHNGVLWDNRLENLWFKFRWTHLLLDSEWECKW